MEKLSEEEAILILNSLFEGWQFLELMDRISDTTIYRQSLKQKVKLLMPELERFVDAIGSLFHVDSKALNNLFEHKKSLALKLITLRPEFSAGLDELLEIYFAAPEEVLDKVGIKIIKQEMEEA
jgi:hypothetical protein